MTRPVDLSVLSERPRIAVMPHGRVTGAYLEEMRSEILRYLRHPGFVLPTTLFPCVFYLMFGVLMARQGGVDIARYLLASYATFGVMAPGLFGFGVSVALERDGGLLTFKRALPMPPAAYFIGKMAMAMLMAGVIVSLLLLLATQLAQVRLDAGHVLRLYATGMLGVLPFCALGMLIGTLVKGQGAPALINLLYLPMAFLSGLWFPLKGGLLAAAPVWPSYHLNQLALCALDMPHAGSVAGHVGVLAVATGGCLLLAARRLRRNG